ncbi:hypothetical protein GGR50DRAFT_456795 [Xylaria sp. CBS 124048]|nr:hypothetical protein GGR50DRAFT_456795 [Xylaria sp. CBS 124048]
MPIDQNKHSISRNNNPVVPLCLIPWDADSEEHVERMRIQRIACGWNVAQVGGWRDAQMAGQLGLHWIVLNPEHPETPSRLEKHITAFPEQAAVLADSSRMILGRPYTPDSSLMPCFHPVGHVSLTITPPKPELQTDIAKGIISLTSLYISEALQNHGLGGAAMRQCEKMAAEFGARTITLETIANEYTREDSPRRIAMKKPVPVISHQDWYSRYGYELYHRKENSWVEVDDTGKEWHVGSVFLRKELL